MAIILKLIETKLVIIDTVFEDFILRKTTVNKSGQRAHLSIISIPNLHATILSVLRR